ncbi:MAG: hypothetical protein KDC35_12440 [Acidobacteria bacterium]|nr:hypothetical protein [Acidobacteriota bacterium]
MEDRHLFDKIWEATKDISVKVSRKAEKHWKINTLRVEIASLRHRITVKHRELGRFVYESIKYQTVDEADYKASVQGLYQEISDIEGEIKDRERRIESLEEEFGPDEADESQGEPEGSEVAATAVTEAPAESAASEEKPELETTPKKPTVAKKSTAAKKRTTGRKTAKPKEEK